MQKSMRIQNQQTIIRLNELTNNEIINLAERAHNIDKSFNEAARCSEASETEEDLEEESSDKGDTASSTDKIISQTANLASDEVGKLKSIDLSLRVAVDILEAEISADQFESIIKANKIDPIPMSTQTNDLINVLNDVLLSIQALRKTLISSPTMMLGLWKLDLMSSPNIPLNTIMLGRMATTYLITYVVNQLFITSNDVIELGWLEREFCSTDRTKFDGIIFKVGNKSISPGLVEFSGGINDRTSCLKNTKDIEKLYSNMMKVMKDSKADKMFCMRCYGLNIYFEKLVKSDGVMYITIDVNMEIPTTPRKLVAYINKIPKILAVINLAINLN
ncbi:hypothetical protein G6F57_012031 [Rhizopus arrhizus]|nr:hypothetical protein G6F30_011762 [Rhizopus arrhizus]KAG1405848.1 hypothetical protein G6F58_009942 [Rhizopus delemar]KAG0974982.1 hypothetical protein G6F29_011850 [Rhizopus arrhizus]KAG0980126.1 hypothetical protein G6F28_011725 [Rhizopus arrhizus]KAG1002559.1 hypothetical protein G6F27_011850 [Rhizopus arrhizus]